MQQLVLVWHTYVVLQRVARAAMFCRGGIRRPYRPSITAFAAQHMHAADYHQLMIQSITMCVCVIFVCLGVCRSTGHSHPGWWWVYTGRWWDPPLTPSTCKTCAACSQTMRTCTISTRWTWCCKVGGSYVGGQHRTPSGLQVYPPPPLQAKRCGLSSIGGDISGSLQAAGAAVHVLVAVMALSRQCPEGSLGACILGSIWHAAMHLLVT